MKKEVKETASQAVTLALSTLLVELVRKAVSIVSGNGKKGEK